MQINHDFLRQEATDYKLTTRFSDCFVDSLGERYESCVGAFHVIFQVFNQSG